MLSALLCLFVMIGGAARTYAQEEALTDFVSPDAESASQETDEAADYDLKKGTYEFGAWGGGSFGTTTFLGRSPNRKLAIAAFQAGRVLSVKKRYTLVYTVDVIPFVKLIQPRDGRIFDDDNGRPIIATSGPDATAVGLSPLGAKFLFRPRERVKPFLHVTGGFLYFDKAVPYDVARNFNFAVDVGGGVQVFSKSRSATTLGYKFHHISNANTKDVNPGIDSHIFYLGFSFFRR